MTGNFYAWSLTLWGASIDPSKAVPWNFPENSVEYHETLPAAPDATKVYIPVGATTYVHTKPTANLPADHGTAPGESHEDFTNGASTPEADTGYLDGLKQNSTWLIVAGGVVLIFAGSVAAFFIMRKRRRGGSGGTGGGDYEFVPEDEDISMSALEGGSSRSRDAGRSTRGKGKAGKRAKELYDAFDENESEDEDEDAPLARSAAQVPYHDDQDLDADDRFTITDDGEKTPNTATGGYRDDEGQPEREEEKKEKGKGKEKELLFDLEKEKEDTSSGSGGSGSWQDAGAEVGK